MNYPNRLPQNSSLPPVSVAAAAPPPQDGRDPVVDGADAARSGHVDGGENVEVDADDERDDLDGLSSDPNLGCVVAPHPDSLVERPKLPFQDKWHVVTVGYPCGIHQVWGNAQAAAATRGGTSKGFIEFSDAREYYKACYEQGNCWVSDKSDLRRSKGKKKKGPSHSGRKNDPIPIVSSPIYISSTPVSPAERSGTSGSYLPMTPTNRRNAAFAAAPVTPSHSPINLRLTTPRTTVLGPGTLARFFDTRAVTTATTTDSRLPMNSVARTTRSDPSTLSHFSDSTAALTATTGMVAGTHPGNLVQNAPLPHASTLAAASTRAPEVRTGQKNSKKRYVTVSDSDSSDQLGWTRQKNVSSAATRVKKPKNSAPVPSAPSSMQAVQGTQLAAVALSAQPTQVVQPTQPPAPPVAVTRSTLPVHHNATAGPSNHATSSTACFPEVINVSDFDDEPPPPRTKRRGAKKRHAPKVCLDSDGYEYTNFDGDGWEQIGKILDNPQAAKDASPSM
ncbi:hypothetical protein GALMADRAFT_134647 [Galerina marginata CBS 339.88]|uniref:Uncharacterized protein n=1 Tax=Galerina marginata (strain CBS 339.88) TaxID=685588 RepID=A0A067TLC7_GALM3|nr:hypothetical protein GALMADRAFT_134647 [Galerina marginata CBS 339.88]